MNQVLYRRGIRSKDQTMTTKRTTEPATVLIEMSEIPRLDIRTRDWPVIVEKTNGIAIMAVRQHKDGRRIVYGYCPLGENPPAGHLVPAKAPGVPMNFGDQGTLRALKRVSGVVGGDPSMIKAIVDELPPERID